MGQQWLQTNCSASAIRISPYCFAPWHSQYQCIRIHQGCKYTLKPFHDLIITSLLFPPIHSLLYLHTKAKPLSGSNNPSKSGLLLGFFFIYEIRLAANVYPLGSHPLSVMNRRGSAAEI